MSDPPAHHTASQAQVPTSRAGRYLAQLCSHGAKMKRPAFHHPRGHADGSAPPAAQHADWSDTEGTIEFGWGRCTLRATDDALILSAEADDEQLLQRVEEGIARGLERIGRRDQLTVTWQRTPPPPQTASDDVAEPWDTRPQSGLDQ